MGWCHEFGLQVREGCEHPMEAGAGACTCAVCGTACGGRFAGCDVVWARGPRRVARLKPPPGRAEAVSPAHEAPPPADERPDDLVRLVAAVDALRDDVAALAAAVASRGEALDESSARLAGLVEGLPARIGDAVRRAVQAHAANGAPPATPDAAAPPPEGPEPAAGRRVEWDALRTRLAALTREPPAPA